MKISARNRPERYGSNKSPQDPIYGLKSGVIEVAPGVEVVSVITKASSESLGLEVGKEVYAAIKASNVMLATD